MDDNRQPAGVWLHAVTRDAGPCELDGVAGIGGRAVRTVHAGGLVAVVSSVDLAQFGEEPLRRNLEDLDWLETVARAHHSVVETVGRSRPVVPARLTTVYRDDAGLRAMLEQRRGDFDAVLDRVSGRTEWGVKTYAVPTSERLSGTPPAETARPGTAYLQRRRAQLSAEDQRWQLAVAGAEEVHAALTGCAAAARRHPPQDRRLSGRTEPMLLNGAYLVERRDADRFGAAVTAQAARHPGLHLELTGPWPPYSFVTNEFVTAEEEPPR
ncbi:GvpL/GvpF family gas vesicle protein [Dactylosporangium siamense]|uniref:Gas vesicle protein n=1 Tax=Dactylosporangium siamense TaxID=685454 RepID=A0A919U9X7_9ACTN|nr:GvpL/GvpF family gas vesicle protein [Dactylosporangium siamense]GIG47964.1 gas vesicle protein [Dactylosporangium siamense]